MCGKNLSQILASYSQATCICIFLSIYFYDYYVKINLGDNMKQILILFTGGTISMGSSEDSKKTVIKDNHLDLLNLIEERLSDVKLTHYIYSMVPSPSLTPNDMLNIAKLVNKYLNEENYDGIVITHGTDTLEETAFFLDSYLNTNKPVVVTGSMRNYDEIGYDGFSNLYSSILVAIANESHDRGVLVCLNDEINAAFEVIKTHTLALDTFKSLEFGPLGLVDESNVLYFRQAEYSKYSISPEKLTKDVAILNISSGMNDELIKYYVNQKVSGLIIEGFGRGNIPANLVNSIKMAVDSGVTVVMTSRCPVGRVRDTYAYQGGGYQLKSIGVLSGNSLPSYKARLLLMLILSANLDPKMYFNY